MREARGGPGARPLQTRDHTVVTFIHYVGQFAGEPRQTQIEQPPQVLLSDLADVFTAWRTQAPADEPRRWTPRFALETLAAVTDARRRRGELPFAENAPDGLAATHDRPWDAAGDVEFHARVSYQHDTFTLALSLTTALGSAADLAFAYRSAPSRFHGPASHRSRAEDEILGLARVNWAEYDANDAPDLRAATATIRTLLRPWQEQGIVADGVVLDADVQVMATSFGFFAIVAALDQPEYAFLVRRTEQDDDALAEASAALNDVMPVLTVADAKVRWARAHLDVLATRSETVRSRATAVLDATNANTHKTRRRFGYATHAAEQRAIADLAERIPELSTLRDDLAAERQVIAINRTNLAHHAWRLHQSATGSPFEQAVLRFADLTALQADADIGRVERVLDRVTLELEAVRVSAGVRTLRLDQNLTIVLATFVLLAIPQAFPELHRLAEEWTWLAAAAPFVRIVLLPLAAIASAFVLLLVLDIVITRWRERFGADR